MARRARRLAPIILLLGLVAALIVTPLAGAAVMGAYGPRLHPLTVRLGWEHQTQYAGFYLADRQNYFKQEGLRVRLEAGNPISNPIEALRNGEADIAVSSLQGALALQGPGLRFTNIAQIFQLQPLQVLCRPSRGVSAPADIFGKRVGTARWGDAEVLQAMLRRIQPGGGPVQLIGRGASGDELVSGDAACITAVTYNETLRVQAAGVPSEDLLVLRPEAFGVVDLADGLYVRSERLGDPAFRQQLVGFLRALRQGWSDARRYPSLAVTAALERNPSLDPGFQNAMLEAVLALIPEADFGLLNLDQVDALTNAEAGPRRIASGLWTHRIWNALQSADGRARRLTPSTRHALQAVARHPLFAWLVITGTLMYGMGGALLAIERGYNIWGRLLLAAFAAIGGGAIRDLLIGGPRLPLFFIGDPSLPLAILAVVLFSSLLAWLQPDLRRTRVFDRTMRLSDITGSAVIATNGAIVSLVADVPWVWVPVMAALSCAGGGILQDIITNQPPSSFLGRLLADEERGVLSGFVLLLAVWRANQVDHGTLLIVLGVLLAVAVNLLVRIQRRALLRHYPQWLAGHPGDLPVQ